MCRCWRGKSMTRDLLSLCGSDNDRHISILYKDEKSTSMPLVQSQWHVAYSIYAAVVTFATSAFFVTEHDKEGRKDSVTRQCHKAVLTSQVNATWQCWHGKSMTCEILNLCGSGDVSHASVLCNGTWCWQTKVGVTRQCHMIVLMSRVHICHVAMLTWKVNNAQHTQPIWHWCHQPRHHCL